MDDALDDAGDALDDISGANNVVNEGSVRNNPLQDIVYTDKVKQQMGLGDYHS